MRYARILFSFARRVFTTFLLLIAGCALPGLRNDEAEWERAEQLWRSGSIEAHAAWSALEPSSEQGHDALVRMREADTHYREGIRLFASAEEGAREALAQGRSLAPMDPELYFPLGEACLEREIPLRAAQYFTKYLGALPHGAHSSDAREHLYTLDPELAGVFDPIGEPSRVPSHAPGGHPLALLLLGAFLGVALGAGLVLGAQAARNRGVSLSKLIDARPEVHPSVAYLVGSLRHELLKHRIGAVRDALEGDGALAEHLEFLRQRLFAGKPLVDAWEGHLVAFRRALGPRVDLRRDRRFRDAAKAIQAIANAEAELMEEVPSDQTIRGLRRSHERLLEFDAWLASLVGGLVRTEIDESLLHEIIDAVRAEHAAGNVILSSCEVQCTDELVEVEIFRADLVLVLKNIVRNALLAMHRENVPGMLKMHVDVELEPTGDETIRIATLDTSPESPDSSILFDRRVDRGLGLVAAAIHRYGGAIEVEEQSEESAYRKAVVVSFFRSA